MKKRTLKDNKLVIKPCTITNGAFSDNFYQIYFEYESELRRIDSTITDPIETEMNCIIHSYNCPNYIDNVIYYNDEPIGIICYQDIDWLKDKKKPILYIDHFYIKPEYRHQGFGKKAFTLLFETYSRYVTFLYYLNRNSSADKFWHSVISAVNASYIVDDRCMTTFEDDAKLTCQKLIFEKGVSK